MTYEAVCEYSNKQHSTFNQYQLPYYPVLVGDDEIETEEGILYWLTPTEEWNRVDHDDNNGRTIDPIEWTGGEEEFSVNITGRFRIDQYALVLKYHKRSSTCNKR
jgi:hypothetical protein